VTASVVLLLIFLAASLGIAAGYSIWNDLFRRLPSRTRQRMEAEFGKESSQAPGRSALFKAAASGPPPPRGMGGAEDLLGAAEDKGLTARLDALLAQSGLPITRRQLAYISSGTAMLLAVAGLAVQGGLLALAGLLAGACGPLLYVRMRRNGRQQRFVAQLPGAFDLMARVLRAGHSVPQSFQAVADTFEDPIAGEFGFCQEQQNLGLLPEVTYRELASRADVLEMKIFVMAMLVQRQTGGNLSEVLERLAQLVRDRIRLRNHVRTLTAEGRMQAAVLLVLPVFMFFVMRFINPCYTDVLLEHPSLLAGAGAAMGLGALWIRKIVHFDF
jgi:tight adherence protein B